MRSRYKWAMGAAFAVYLAVAILPVFSLTTTTSTTTICINNSSCITTTITLTCGLNVTCTTTSTITNNTTSVPEFGGNGLLIGVLTGAVLLVLFAVARRRMSSLTPGSRGASGRNPV